MPTSARLRQLSYALLLVLASFRPSAAAAPSWVFRGSLDGEASPMVFLALNRDMTLAYDEGGGSLLLAWKGPAAPAAGPSAPADPAAGMGPGKAPAAASGPRFAATGPVYHRRLAPAPWSVHGPKGRIPVTVRFEGASAHGDLAQLAWTLRLPGGRSVRVREVPMFDDHYGDAGLFRNFTLEGIPPGHRVRLELDGAGMQETWGGGGNGGVVEGGGRRALVQEFDGETPLKVTWTPVPPPAALPAPGLPPPPAPGR